MEAESKTSKADLERWLTGRPAATASQYRKEVERFEAWSGKALLSAGPMDLQAYAEKLWSWGLAYATRRKKVAMIISVLQDARLHLGEKPYCDQYRPILRRQSQAIAAVAESEVRRLLLEMSNCPTKVLVALIFYAGLRLQTACQLTWGQIGPERPWYVSLIAGSRRKVAELPPCAQGIVTAWRKRCWPVSSKEAVLDISIRHARRLLAAVQVSNGTKLSESLLLKANRQYRLQNTTGTPVDWDRVARLDKVPQGLHFEPEES